MRVIDAPTEHIQLKTPIHLDGSYLNEMSYSHANVKLSECQIEKLKSKDDVTCSTKITLKHEHLSGGPKKLSLTKTQANHLNKAKCAGKEFGIFYFRRVGYSSS